VASEAIRLMCSRERNSDPRGGRPDAMPMSRETSGLLFETQL
jgi:hypothetical protein